VEDIDQEKPLNQPSRNEKMEASDLNVLSDFKDGGDDEDEIITPYKKGPSETKKVAEPVNKSPVHR